MPATTCCSWVGKPRAPVSRPTCCQAVHGGCSPSPSSSPCCRRSSPSGSAGSTRRSVLNTRHREAQDALLAPDSSLVHRCRATWVGRLDAVGDAPAWKTWIHGRRSDSTAPRGGGAARPASTHMVHRRPVHRRGGGGGAVDEQPFSKAWIQPPSRSPLTRAAFGLAATPGPPWTPHWVLTKVDRRDRGRLCSSTRCGRPGR